MDKNKIFENLIRNRESKLYKIAFSYVKNKDDAMDCLQETLLKGINSFDKLKNEEYFDTWIIRILINTCKDFLKSKKSELNYDDQIETSQISKELDETIDLINSIESLSDSEKEVIYLKYFKEYKYNEISNIINIKEGTIKSRINRALAKLRLKLES